MQKKIDIAIIKPGSQKQLYGELSEFQLTAIEPPLWGSLLAAYLLNMGFSVHLFDAEVENKNYEETAKHICDIEPELAAVFVSGTNPSASTMNMIGAAAILNAIRQYNPKIKTVLAGLHPSALPERTMKEENADFVCQGEGFYTLPELIKAIRSHADDFPIEGLWYKKDGRLISNPRPKLMENLDVLPMPAWNLLPMNKYRAHNWHCFDNIRLREPYAVLYTSLGCPFKCSFCCINSLFGKSGIRYRSPEKVIEEIDFLVRNYGVRNIKIIDEMFVLKESHVNQICDMIIDRGYDLNMWAYARVNTVTPNILKKMKKAGINWLAYGFESGNDAVLKGVNKGYSADLIQKAVQMTEDEGIYICANFIFGLPDDNYETMRQTLEMAKKINAEWANLYSVMAYPGSHLYEQAVKENLPLPKTWDAYSQYNYETLPLPTKYLSGAEVLKFRDEAFREYYHNPAYLEKITRKFGAETEEHIRQMAAYKLPRKYIQ